MRLEIAPTIPGSVRAKRRRLTVATVMAIHVAVLFVSPIATDPAGLFPHWRPHVRVDTISPSWLMGATVFITWCVACSPGRWTFRLSLGVLTWLGLVIALLAGESFTPNWLYGLERWLLQSVALTAVTSPVFLAYRRVSRLRMTIDGQSWDESRRPFRYHLKGMMGATALVAVALGMARLINPGKLLLFENFHIPPYRAVVFWEIAIGTIAPAFFVLAVVWFACRSARASVWLLLLVIPLIIAAEAFVCTAYRLYESWNAPWLLQHFPEFLVSHVRHYVWGLTGDRFAIAVPIVLSFEALRRTGLRFEVAGRGA